MALQVKMALLGLPLQYKDFVDTSMPIVENVITIAQSELANTATTSPVTVPIQNPMVINPQPNQPVFGSVPVEVTKAIRFNLQPTYNNGRQTRDNINYWSIQVFYTENGYFTPTTITVSSSDGVISNPNPQLTRVDGFVYESFVASTTNALITATANGITATTTLDSYFQ